MALIKLASLLKGNEDWAMLGPVTNQAGNEQKIPVEGRDVQSTLEEGVSGCSVQTEIVLNLRGLIFVAWQ